MHNKKASMELSVNSIVILVIAVVMMGLILAFIRTKATDLFGSVDQYTKNIPAPDPATASTPITMQPETVIAQPTKTIGVKINLYNTHTGNLINTIPIFACSGADNPISFDTKSMPLFNVKNITAGESASFEGTLTIKGTATRKMYLCQVCITTDDKPLATHGCSANIKEQKDFRLEVQ